MRAEIGWGRVAFSLVVGASLAVACFTNERFKTDQAVAQEPPKQATTKQEVAEPSVTKPDAAEGRTVARDATANSAGGPLRDKLERELSVDFLGVTLADILEYVSKRVDVPMYLDKTSLESAGIDFEQPITLQLKRVRAATLLDLLLLWRQMSWYLHEDGVTVIALDDEREHIPASMIGFGDLLPKDLEERLTMIGRLRDDLPGLFDKHAYSGETSLVIDPRGIAIARVSPRTDQERVERFFRAARRMASLTPEQLRKPQANSTPIAVEYLSSSSSVDTEQIRQKLAKHIDAQFVETPLGDVLQYLSDAADLTCYCDPLTLHDPFFLEQSVTLDAKNWSVERVLRTVLRSLGASWTTVDQVVVICFAESREDVSVRLYPVVDLLVANDWRFKKAHEIHATSTLAEVVKFACGSTIEETHDDVAYVLFPEWGMLAVRNTEDAHRRVEAFLNRLRATVKELPESPPAVYGRSYVIQRSREGGQRVELKEVDAFVRSRLPAATFDGPETTLRVIGDRLFVEHNEQIHGRVRSILATELGVLESVSAPEPLSPTFRLPEGIGGGMMGGGSMGWPGGGGGR